MMKSLTDLLAYQKGMEQAKLLEKSKEVGRLLDYYIEHPEKFRRKSSNP